MPLRHDQITTTWTELLATTLRKYREKLVDNIFKSTPLLWELEKSKDKEEGGHNIVVQIEYDENPNVMTYEGSEELSMDEEEIVSAVEYPWKNLAGSVVINGPDRRKNSGKLAMINLLKARINNCEKSLRKKLNSMFYGDGTGNSGKDFLGLGAIIDNSGTLAGIDRSESGNSFWRANVVNVGTELGAADPVWGGDDDNMIKLMINMFYRCSDGNDKPTMLITDQEIFELYENSQAPKMRYQSNAVADAGFINITFKNTPIVYDEDCDEATMFFLNSDYCRMFTHTQADFTPTPLLKPFNRDMVGQHLLTMGNLTTSQPRRLGKLVNMKNEAS